MNKVNPIERNDVDVAKLFRWKKEVTILDEDEEPILTAYIRLVGDADLNRARVFAIRSSKDYRRILKDLDSDERIALIPEKDELTKDATIDSIVIYSMRDFALDANDQVKIKEPKELTSIATLEDQEEFQEDVDQYPENKKEAIEKYVEQKIEDKRKELSKREFDDMYPELVTKIIDQYCENKMFESFREYSVYLGAYTDKKYTTKFFKNFEEFANLPTIIKDQFELAYSNLELGIDELKN